MRSIWCGALLGAALVVLGCKGEKGDPGQQGPAGAVGQQGPPGPNITIDGLDGGTVNGNSGINGDLAVSGGLTVSGHPVGYRSSPLVVGGQAQWGCQASGSFANGSVVFPAAFRTNPVVVATIDETGDDNGPTWMRLLTLAPNHAGFRCNGGADAVNWFAIEPGTHTISGHQVEAGSVAGAANGGTITFPTAFSAPPIVLLMIDESGDNSGPTFTRVIGNPTATGFQVYLDATADALHWVAMEPGDYQYGRYRWTAGVLAANNSCNTCTLTFPTAQPTAPMVIATVNDTNNSGAVTVRVAKSSTTQMTIRTFDTSGASSATENVFYVLLQDLN